MSDSPPVAGEDCWRIERAVRASVVIDAEAYFRHVRLAMIKAKRRIMLIGWDFDSGISLIREDEAKDGAPVVIGDFITWLVDRTPELEIFLLRWDVGAMKAMSRPANLATTLKWMAHPRITVKLDSHHPPAASHHQKIVVIDDCFAFCGGIDMTADRWDTRHHRDEEPARRHPDGTPYGPWHDATTALAGPVAVALGEHGRARWASAGGDRLEPVEGVSDCWPETLPVQFEQVDVAIARTAPKMDDQDELVEIERLYLNQIAAAKRCVYAESQYFASRRIAEAIALRLAEPDGPEFVIVNPQQADGWLEQQAMDTARARLFEALKARDPHGRFRLYHPFTQRGTPIYVHAKVMIVDDRIIRVGSSNMNNRSLRLDTECDVTIDIALPANDGQGKHILAIRDGLIAEHLNLPEERVAAVIGERGLVAAVEELRRKSGRTLRPYETPELNAVQQYIADHEVLDPEGPEEMFEPISERGLFRRMKGWFGRN
ncbi:phosphatidylserine/phosphatidylglycerophosphate/cardiolipin synthase-like enzyme [Sphingobium sp. OAS761]|uniref:phospholipase D-like domain-containing protein n=1 Tax=Sphingobium sp. OAS761 TaxID=2817901 RepID=UPI0020A1339C|nr:phospholipase D-like domain-containing protein [Sphingobium sp. OAS761]MCP1470057.1 phosphatidylserine/phosphatidylglycerophosphate/cardiolipin synthase-like enzyme [Sphingobium sp. OAS761]